MRKVDIAYIAGLIDGEGYIGIKRTKTLRNGRVNPQYQERIQIRMVDEPAIKFITDMLGGYYYAEKPHSKGRKLYCYSASDRIAINIINTILPYLRVKRNVSLCVLEFNKFRSTPDKRPVKIKMLGRWGKEIEVTRYRFSDEYISRCEKFWKKCSDLNHGR